MTAATAPTAPPTGVRHPEQRVTQVRVIRSEWTKLRSLRSTVYSLFAAVALIVGFSVLVPLVTVAHWPPRDPGELASFDPTTRSLAGIFLAQLAIGVLGVLLVTGEYATGSIRSTFAAVPKRLPVLWAKAIVFTVTTLTLTLVSVLVAFFVGQSILSGKHIETTFGQPGVARAVIGSALYLTVTGLLGLAIGALLRNTAGGISSLFGLLFVLPIIVHFLPSTWADPIDRYLPSTAGQDLTAVVPDPGSLAPWLGFAVFCAYTAILLGLAAVRLRRTDA